MLNLKAVIKYIDLGAAIGALLDVKRDYGDKDEYPDQIIERCIVVLTHLPTIDPASLRPKGEWISVEDRLPQEGGAVCENVILFMDNGLVTVGWLNQITNRGYYLDTINDVVIKAPLSRFTHWMPLPEPPNCGADMREGHP